MHCSLVSKKVGGRLGVVISVLIPAVLLVAGAWSAPAAQATVDQLKQAKECTRQLYTSPKRMKYRSEWQRCLRLYENYYRRSPKGSQADEALFSLGKLNEGLYGQSRRSSDLDAAISRFRQVVKEFPKSPLADDAQYRLGEIYLKYQKDPERAYVEFFKVVMDFPSGDMKPKAQERLAELEAQGGKRQTTVELPPVPAVPPSPAPAESGSETPPPGPTLPSPSTSEQTAVAATNTAPGASVPPSASPNSSELARVTDIRYWSAPDYTRVVIHVDGQVPYTSRLLRADPGLKIPPRLYIDIEGSRLSPSVPGSIPIGDGLLRHARVGQHTVDTVRVVLDIESIERHKIFSLYDPYRIVIDLTGESKALPPAPERGARPTLSLAQQLGLGVKRVVIDPGHGGKDPGAQGPGGLAEKQIALSLAKKLRDKLRKELKLEAILTRETDLFLPLEERTGIANTKKADLFISIHTNASRNKDLRGISTYILNVATDHEAAKLAAFENAVSTKRISDLEKILSDLMLNTKISESTRLAHMAQDEMLRALRSKYSDVRDLGVRQAPFYVLIGAQMPCILVECSFISNPIEARRLASSAYQDLVATGIVNGVRSYIKQVETGAGQG
jgi:N-acetylmuramoyl-L-alanine amidase